MDFIPEEDDEDELWEACGCYVSLSLGPRNLIIGWYPTRCTIFVTFSICVYFYLLLYWYH